MISLTQKQNSRPKSVFASDLYQSATDCELVGEPLEKGSAHCCVCGKPIVKEDLHSTQTVTASGLKDRVDYFCGVCPTFLSDTKLVKQSAAITMDGIINLADPCKLLQFIQNPPKPPFLLWAGGIKESREVAWYTVVTRDLEKIQVQVGTNRLTIDPKYLADELIPAVKRLTGIVNDNIDGADAIHPFQQETFSMMVVPNLCKTAIEFGDRDDINTVFSASTGELWLLALQMGSD